MRYLTKGLLLTLTLSLALQVVAVGQPISSGWGVGCKELAWAVPDRHGIFNATSAGTPASQMGPILEPNGIVQAIVAPMLTIYSATKTRSYGVKTLEL